MLVGGVTADLGGEKNKTYLDRRVKCILPISAQGTGQQGLTDKSWDTLKLPMMTITGTRDRGAGGQGAGLEEGAVRAQPAGDKYLVVIDGANHVSFGGGLGPRGDDVVACVALAGTHFWDAYLKDSATSKEYLLAGRLAGRYGREVRVGKQVSRRPSARRPVQTIGSAVAGIACAAVVRPDAPPLADLGVQPVDDLALVLEVRGRLGRVLAGVVLPPALAGRAGEMGQRVERLVAPRRLGPDRPVNRLGELPAVLLP
jgi:hypothetical protein